MAENRFSKGVKAAKERTAEIEANKKKQEQEVDQTKIEELPEEQTETKIDIGKSEPKNSCGPRIIPACSTTPPCVN